MVALSSTAGHFFVDDALREALGDGGLAHARVADEEGVVLGPPAKDLHRAFDLGGAPDQRVDAPVARLGVEVDAIGLERRRPLLDGAFAFVAVFVAVGRAGLGHPRRLGDAVADISHGVEAGHVLAPQEEDGVRFAFGEDGDQQVGAGDFLAARHLHMVDGALDDALETRRGLGAAFAFLGGGDARLFVEELGEGGAQRVDIDAARAHYGERILILGERQQEVFEGGELVLPFVGQRERAMQRLLECLRQHGIRLPPRRGVSPFRGCIGAGVRSGARSPPPA